MIPIVYNPNDWCPTQQQQSKVNIVPETPADSEDKEFLAFCLVVLVFCVVLYCARML